MCFFPPTKRSNGRTKKHPRNTRSQNHTSSAQYYNLGVPYQNEDSPIHPALKTQTNYGTKTPITIETTYYPPPPWDLHLESSSSYHSNQPSQEYFHTRPERKKEGRRSSVLSDIDFIQTLQTKLSPPRSDPAGTAATSIAKEAEKKEREEMKAELEKLRREKEAEEWKREISMLRREMQDQKREVEVGIAVGKARVEGAKEGEERAKKERERERNLEVELEKARTIERAYLREREREWELQAEQEKLRAAERELAREREREREQERDRLLLLASANASGRMANPYMPTSMPRNHNPNDSNISWHFHVNSSNIPSSNVNLSGMDGAPIPSFSSFGRSDVRRGGDERDVWNVAAEEIRVLGRRMTRMEDSHAAMMETMERDRERHLDRGGRGRRYWN